VRRFNHSHCLSIRASVEWLCGSLATLNEQIVVHHAPADSFSKILPTDVSKARTKIKCAFFRH
jgi:hypothetical protein